MITDKRRTKPDQTKVYISFSDRVKMKALKKVYGLTSEEFSNHVRFLLEKYGMSKKCVLNCSTGEII